MFDIQPSDTVQDLLEGIPSSLKEKLLIEFDYIKQNFDNENNGQQPYHWLIKNDLPVETPEDLFKLLAEDVIQRYVSFVGHLVRVYHTGVEGGCHYSYSTKEYTPLVKLSNWIIPLDVFKQEAELQGWIIESEYSPSGSFIERKNGGIQCYVKINSDINKNKNSNKNNITNNKFYIPPSRVIGRYNGKEMTPFNWNLNTIPQYLKDAIIPHMKFTKGFDQQDRSHYEIIEKYLQLVEMSDRLIRVGGPETLCKTSLKNCVNNCSFTKDTIYDPIVIKEALETNHKELGIAIDIFRLQSQDKGWEVKLGVNVEANLFEWGVKKDNVVKYS